DKTRTSLARARPALTRRERHKLRTREALLNAARSLLVDRSIDALSIDEIADRADVAKGTFYNYFADKDALARELTDKVRAHIEEEIARTNVGVKDPPLRIARALSCALRLGLREREQMVTTARLFPHATDPSAPQNAGVREDVIAGLSQQRITAASPDAAIAAI